MRQSAFALGIQLFRFNSEWWKIAYELPVPFNGSGVASTMLLRALRDLLDGLDSRFEDDVRGRVDPGGTIVVSSEEKAKVETLLSDYSRMLARGNEEKRVEYMRHVVVVVVEMSV